LTARLSFKIYFATTFVQNLFCDGWSAKFILQRLSFKIYFATAFVQKIDFATVFVPKFILQRFKILYYKQSL